MFSYKVAGALKLVEHPVIHVNDVLESGTLTFGQNDTPDEIIAEWCGPSQHVLVTVDADFRGRWLRSGLLAAHRVEVVVFSSDVPGLANQHATISTRQSARDNHQAIAALAGATRTGALHPSCLGAVQEPQPAPHQGRPEEPLDTIVPVLPACLSSLACDLDPPLL